MFCVAAAVSTSADKELAGSRAVPASSAARRAGPVHRSHARGTVPAVRGGSWRADRVRVRLDYRPGAPWLASAAQLAANHEALQLMCTAVTEAFAALRHARVTGLPRNLAILHSPPLKAVAIRYWARTMRSPAGELCFAAHARHAQAEIQALGDQVAARLADSPAPATCVSSCSPPPHEPARHSSPGHPSRQGEPVPGEDHNPESRSGTAFGSRGARWQCRRMLTGPFRRRHLPLRGSHAAPPAPVGPAQFWSRSW
jgi:hypothetical protein